MKTNTSSFSLHSVRRAQFSPLTSRRLLGSAARSLSAPTASSRPASGSLTPATPTLGERFWNPHLIDRLQTPLSRVRE